MQSIMADIEREIKILTTFKFNFYILPIIDEYYIST